MDDKLYEIFSENTDIPAVVREHAQNALFQIQEEAPQTSLPKVRARGAGFFDRFIAAALTYSSLHRSHRRGALFRNFRLF